MRWSVVRGVHQAELDLCLDPNRTNKPKELLNIVI